jgi:cyclic-di-AMP phosphodiesterase PgpH
MKHQQFFKSLTQQVTYWRRHYKRRKGKLLRAVRVETNQTRWEELQKTVVNKILLEDGSYKSGIALSSIAKSVKPQSWMNTIGLSWVHENRSSVILAIAVLSLTGVIGHKLYYQPKLKQGTVATQTIKAPFTDNIENPQKTADRREAASNNSLPMLMVDEKINEKIHEKLQQILNEGDEIRNTAGTFPFAQDIDISLDKQRYLRSCSLAEWQQILVALEKSRIQQNELLLSTNQKLDSLKFPPQTSKPTNVAANSEVLEAVKELEIYRSRTSQQYLSILIEQILQARQKYNQAKLKLAKIEANRLQVIYEPKIFLDLLDEDWTKTRTGIRQSAERIITQGISQGLPANVLKEAVNLQVQTSVPSAAEPLAKKILLAVLQPNLKKDEEKTLEQAKTAAKKVKPYMVEVKQGEVIVTKGKVINKWNIHVLEHYRLNRREINWPELLKLTGIVTTGIGVFVCVERRLKHKLRQRDRLLVLLLTLSTPGMIMIGVMYHTNWSAIGLLLGSFYGPTLGATVVGLLLLVLPISIEVSKIGLIAGAAGGIVGSCMAKRLRSREELALLGLAIASTQGGIYLILSLIFSSASSYLILKDAALFALSGLAWSIVALGLSPYLEKLFDLVTPIRLAELANPNRPLLKQLATEAPGTFQHTLFVATLAEAAAKKLRCDVELVRAGTLYHDIGKMHDPLGFIENQMGGPNKHDTEIKDPWKSAEIIKKHVAEGLVMARKHLLPTAIQAFIPEHQGTMLIAYFHHQAQQMAKEDPNLTVDDAHFRYDGPIPQSRETAIVMLADSCEAALRTLKDASTEQALTMVNNIFRARWQDDQLKDSGLTRDEVAQIAHIFVEVWQQFHHKRIAYPKLKPNKEN